MLPINVNLPLRSVTDRIRSCRAVKWAIDTHGTALVDNLGESFGSLLAESQEAPFAIQLELFEKKLTLDLDRVVTTDRAYRDQKARESISRTRRDELARQVSSGVIGLRQAFTGIYSEQKLAEFGFARRTPKQIGELQEQASHLVARLGDPDLDLTGSSFGDFQLDAPTLARNLVRSVDRLQVTADELAREERKTEALKLAKDEALSGYNTSFLWIARTVESLCRLAGLEEVAKRVRPSVRRPGVTARRFEPADAQSDAQAEGEDAEGAEGEASPEAASDDAGADAPRTP